MLKLRRWGKDDVESGWADGKMPPEACVWWPGTIVLLFLLCVWASGMAYFWDPVASKTLLKLKFCELMLFCPVIIVVVEGCPCGPNGGIFPGYHCMGVIELPNDGTTSTQLAFVHLHKAAEALSSFFLFPDCLPGSQVHRDYFWKIYVQCTKVSVLRNYMGFTGLQFSSALLSMKIKFVHHQYGSIFQVRELDKHYVLQCNTVAYFMHSNALIWYKGIIVELYI